jgi:DNA-binding NarL/FixJ family response regulator
MNTPSPTKVLLLEDSPSDELLVEDALNGDRPGSFAIVCAASLAEGLEKLASAAFDVIVLDLSLPDSQGIASFCRIREVAGETPIVVHSGLEDEAMAVRALQEGAQDYLIKGRADAERFTHALRYAIERKRTERKHANLVAQLQASLAQIKRLSGLLSTCAWCKRVADEEGWHQLEHYVKKHSEADFSHGICPECMERHLQGLDRDLKEKDAS